MNNLCFCNWSQKSTSGSFYLLANPRIRKFIVKAEVIFNEILNLAKIRDDSASALNTESIFTEFHFQNHYHCPNQMKAYVFHIEHNVL
jgi:hypothetical protein